MTEETIRRFWKEFRIATQDKNPDFPFANPSDAAKSLVNARNWTATITEELMSTRTRLSAAESVSRANSLKLDSLERKAISNAASGGNLPSWATKNKQVQKAYAMSCMTASEGSIHTQLEEEELEINNNLGLLQTAENNCQSMLRAIEKTTDWLVQYLNWSKFELRDLSR